MNKEIKEIIKEIASYENEEMCMILLSQKQNKALINYISNLGQENKQLKEGLLKVKKFIDKHTGIIEETETKCLSMNLQDDNELINIINKTLGEKE